MSEKLLDTSNELLVYRYKNGIKLLKSSALIDDHNERFTQHTVKSMLTMPFSVYFDNHEAVIQRLNSHNAELCDFDSEKQATGKSYFKRFTTSTAHHLLRYDHEAMINEATKIYEETIQYDDNHKAVRLLSVKMPWYSVENKVIGLFGCCVNLDKNPIADFLTSMTEMGLFNIFENKNIDNEKVFLPKQQKTCAIYLLQGLTNKDVALKMNLSERTIESYIETMKNKFHCSNKTQLILKLSKIM